MSNRKPIKVPYVMRFLSVCESGNMAESARMLGVTQPEMARSIEKIEKAFGLPLIARISGWNELTDAGGRLQQLMTEFGHEYEASINETRSYYRSVENTVNVGNCTEGSAVWLEQLLALAKPNFAKINAPANQESAFEDLLEHRIDLLITDRHSRDEIPNRLQVDSVPMGGTFLLMKKSHRLAGESEIKIKDLAGESLIVSGVHSRNIAATLGSEGRNTIQAMTASSAVNFVRRDLGIALLGGIDASCQSEDLISRPLPELRPMFEWQCHICTRVSENSAEVSRLHHFLLKHLPQLKSAISGM
jgi:DNA-binding transcriptional LysR family regulator